MHEQSGNWHRKRVTLRAAAAFWTVTCAGMAWSQAMAAGQNGIEAVPQGTKQATEKAATNPSTGRCAAVSDITRTRALSDQRVWLYAPGHVVDLRLRRLCPQLAFHQYFTYTAVGGVLCADRDRVMARAGEICDVADISILPLPTGETGPAAPTPNR